MPLTDVECRKAAARQKPWKLSDGNGLYLVITPSGGKYWRWDFRLPTGRGTASFGVYPGTPLKKARESLLEAKAIVATGRSPSKAKAEDKKAKRRNSSNSFEAIAYEWFKRKADPRPAASGKPARPPEWAAVTAKKTLSYLRSDVLPEIGDRPISDVSAVEMGALFEKVQSRGADYTATRIRELCSQIFNFAIQRGLANSNPAHAFVRALNVPHVVHRPAITDRRQFGVFLRSLASYENADRLTLIAIRIALLTFLRSSELRGGRWSEIDFLAKEWRVPAKRMKMGKGSRQDHIVPLSDEAISSLKDLQPISGDGIYMFPSAYGGGGGVMSENTIGRTLVRMGYQGQQSLHGFRASGRSLLSERKWSVAALERQLDHSERNQVIAAYARSEHLEERKSMMSDWGGFVNALELGHDVVPLYKISV